MGSRKIRDYLFSRIREEGCIHLSLFDPAKISGGEAKELARGLEKAGTSAFLVGGSVGVDHESVREVVRGIKEGSSLPAILFPSSPASLIPEADAVFFLSLLNSLDPYYITGAQAEAAPIVKKYSLEAIPVAYIVVSPGKGAGFVGKALPIPRDGLEVAKAYAMAAELMGATFVYLEAGSGAKKPVPREMVGAVASSVGIPVIVGGGIRDPDTAASLASSGASAIVTGTLIEERGVEAVRELIRAIKKRNTGPI